MAARDGTAGADSLVGTSGDDILRGLAGDDTLIGLAGDDRLEGGDGNDVLIGGDGNDTLIAGGYGEELLIGGRGNDLMIGLIDTVRGGQAHAIIDATLANAVLSVRTDSFATPSIHISSVDGNDEVAGVGFLNFSDKQITTASVFNISDLYVQYLNRQPNAAEYIYWVTTPFAPGFGLEAALRRDSGAAAAVTDQVIAAYQSYAARPPSGAEVSAWINYYASAGFAPSYVYGVVASGIRATTEGRTTFTNTITSFYTEYFGRNPLAAELTAWRGLTFDQPQYSYDYARRYIVAASEAQTYLNGQIDVQYQRYAGRAATDQEHGDWLGNFSSGLTLANLKDAVISLGTISAGVESRTGTAGADTFALPSGFASAVIRDLDVTADRVSLAGTPYSALNPYDPTRAQQVAATDGSGTQDVLVTLDATHFVVIKNVDREQYLSHSTETIDSFYQRYFGRTTVSTEKAVWDDLFADGRTFDTLQSTLIRSTESANTGVARVNATSAADTFAYAPASGDVIINGFNTTADVVSLRGGAYAGTDPLAAGLAKEVANLAGGTDVLLTFGPDNVLLLQSVRLAQLHSENFLF